eukprot:TRINITY_DN6419_c0_g1_i1.p1 TRINITY_DN6419_c0_g1~~TRINITY_DN6419_c0_g1_i1.p1  ORF type:complete len:985 (+),score=236.50 TRINITY_DN6419_c0_g1_i1:123-3077(+)
MFFGFNQCESRCSTGDEPEEQTASRSVPDGIVMDIDSSRLWMSKQSLSAPVFSSSAQPNCDIGDEPMPTPPPELTILIMAQREFVWPEGVPREMAGWLMCYGGDSSASTSRLQVAKLAKVSAGTPVAGLFWRKRYIQVKSTAELSSISRGAQLTCWATLPEKDQKGRKPRPVATLPLMQLEEVARDGKTLTLHMRGLKVAFQARAENEIVAAQWAAVVKAAAAQTLSRNLPPGWDVQAMLSSGEGKSNAKLVNKETLPAAVNPAFQKLVDHCFVCKTTKDRRGKIVPLRIEVVEIVRVQNGAAWMDYDKARQRIAEGVLQRSMLERQMSDISSTGSNSTNSSLPASLRSRAESDQDLKDFSLEFPVMTSSLHHEQLFEVLGQTDATCNEHWLFHGTSKAGVDGISDEEFRLNLAGSHRGTMYGKGMYFAECTTKADEYSEEDEDGYCWMLLCRAALGKTMVCKEKKVPPDILEQCKKEGYDSLIGDRWAAVGTFREFILSDANQVYPAFIVRYKRWPEAAFCRSIRETSESLDAEAARMLFPHAAIVAEEHPDSAVRYRLSLLLDAHAEAVVPVLCMALRDPRRRVRLNAGKALMNMAGQTSTVEALPDGTLYRRQREGTHAVLSAVPALQDALSDSDRFVRRSAARSLERLGEHAALAVPALIQALKDPEEEVRAAVATALGQLGSASAQALPTLLQAASEDPVERVRVAACTALGHLGALVGDDDSVEPVLVARLEDSRSEVRSAAAGALGMLAMPSAVAPLALHLEDSEAHVRASAARALGNIGGADAAVALPKLIQCLKDTDHVVRKATAVTLGRMGYHAAPAAITLAETMRDSNSQVREATAHALSLLELTENIPQTVTIQALLKRGVTDSVTEVRIASVDALSDLARLGQLGTQLHSVKHAMTVRLKDESPQVNNSASTCLKIISLQAERIEAEKRKKKKRAKSKDEDYDDEGNNSDDSGPGLEELARLVSNMSKQNW